MADRLMPTLAGTALAACLAFGVMGCREPVEPAAGAQLLTGEITGMAGACYADVTGHKSLLSRDPMDGTAMFNGTELIPVMWPVGYTARIAGEQLEVLDSRKEVVATTGRFYILIGRYHAGIFQTCMHDKPEEVKP